MPAAVFRRRNTAGHARRLNEEISQHVRHPHRQARHRSPPRDDGSITRRNMPDRPLRDRRSCGDHVAGLLDRIAVADPCIVLSALLGWLGTCYVKRIVLPAWQIPDDDEMALRVQQQLPTLGSRLIAAVQLARAVPAGASVSLIRAHIEQTEKITAAARFQRGGAYRSIEKNCRASRWARSWSASCC